MDFGDKVVLITGVSSGIGQRLALDLAARGATVVGCGRSQERMYDTLKEMRRISPASSVHVCNVSVPQQVEEMVGKVMKEFGRIDVLINNAGFGARKPFVETPPSLIEQMMRTNFLGTVYCTREVLPSMVARRSGHIVNISSVAGKIGTPNMASYCATKFALIGLTESLYHELRPFGIKVSVICPGSVRTKFNLLFDDLAFHTPAFLVLDSASVSRAIIRAIDKNKYEVVMPHWLALVCLFKRLMPNVFRRISYHTLRLQSGLSRSPKP